MDSKPCRQAVGSLMVAATVSWLYMIFAVSMVSRFLYNPGLNHWHAVKRIIKYLQGTKDQGSSHKQKGVIIPKIEAEYAAVSTAATEVVWLHDLLSEICFWL
ncbi:uncharacterized protein LOC126355723 [Schistocerca gregaria]|uniref:uncharacterized protein LOC126355723 n=1 Tax=Schistocerca gregaria TaxID=7010 RepID=UPI00211EC47E|nr:uncharacterized protein LOC126355723 [Schistocerca gregaria]